MKNTILITILSIFGLFACGSSYAQSMVKKKVAVYIVGNDVGKSVKKILGAKIVTAVTESGEFAAVERTAEFLRALEKESDYQTSGEVRDSQIAKLGQKFGVKYVIVADVSEAFDELFVASRLINVETGLVERAYDVNGPTESLQQLINISNSVVNGLLSKSSISDVSQINNNIVSGRINGHDYVDLGLPSRVKWATCNVGANLPSDNGKYYAWGELSNAGEGNGAVSKLSGVVIGDISGNPQYDVARAYWGSPWRIPSKNECDELINTCKWYWITGFGYKIVGPNGNSIYLPAARYGSEGKQGAAGDYWTSTPNSNRNEYAWWLFFNDNEIKTAFVGIYRSWGITIRPVFN